MVQGHVACMLAEIHTVMVCRMSCGRRTRLAAARSFGWYFASTYKSGGMQGCDVGGG